MMVSPSGSPERMSRSLGQPSFRRNGGSSNGSQVRGWGRALGWGLVTKAGLLPALAVSSGKFGPDRGLEASQRHA